MTPAEKLQRFHASADNAIYAAEVECGIVTGRGFKQCKFPDRPCLFSIETNIRDMRGCRLPAIRALLGDHYASIPGSQEIPKRDLPNEIHKGIQFINDVFWGQDKK